MPAQRSYQDIGLTSTLDLPVNAAYVGGETVIAQRVKLGLSLHLGEFAFDKRVGMPYVQWSEVKPAPLATIAAKVRQVIDQTRGVVSIQNFSQTFEDQEVKITAYILTDDGEVTVELVRDAEGPANIWAGWQTLVRSGPISP